MNINLSKLANFKVDSWMQQGLDSILSRSNPSEGITKDKIRVIKRSLDQKGELYQLPPSHNFTLSAYQIRRLDAVGSILVTLDHLRNFYKQLNQEILEQAAKGNLRKADKYIHQRRNVDITHYTHRLKVYRITQNKAKIMVWIIDLDLHKESSDENSYGSGTARAMVQDLATHFLDDPLAKESSKDYLDVVVDLDWVKYIRKISRPYYNHSQLEYKVIYHNSLNAEVRR